MKKIFAAAAAALLTLGACNGPAEVETQNNVTITELENGTNVTETNTTVVTDE